VTTSETPLVRTRDRILDVAFDMFVTEGFGGTAIIEVERRVGLKPGTGSFYRHFRSKEDLLRAAVAREVTHCAAEIAAAYEEAPSVDDPRPARAHELGCWLQDIQRFHRLFRLLLSDGDRFPEVREAIAAARPAAFEGPRAERDATDVVATAALLGYQLLGYAWGEPYLDLTEDEFIAALIEATERPARPARGRREPD
jgi:AcrR family transcriptional regulator